MKCPNCNKEYDSPRYWCSECNYFFEPTDFLSFVNEEVVNKYKNVDNKCPIFPKDHGKIIFKNIDLQTNDFIYKSEYINGELSPEEFTIKFYEELGYDAIWTENNYWTILFFLYYFEDLGQSHTIYDLKFHLNKTQLGRTLDFTKLDDYSNNINHIITSYYIHFIYFIARDSNKFLGEYFSIDELLLAFIYLNTEQVKLIFERLWDDFNYFKTGFPDLIVYNEKEFFFVEVKSKNDDPSFKQIQWHKFLSEIVNVDVVLFTLSKTEKELEYLKNRYDKELLKYKKTYKDNKIYLTPHIGTFDDYKTKTLFLTYFLKPSSGNGEERELLEIVEIPSNDENTRSHDFKNLINVNESNEEEIYKKILKQYPPTMFVDYRPTKKQLKRNKDAEIFEGMGEYDEAIKLYEKNVSEKCGSPTTYKKLIRIYKKLNNPSRILELIEEAIPVFTTLNNKKMVLNLIYYRNDAIRQKDDIRYLKILSIKENDYLYENCCVDDANKIVLKKIEELESKTTGGYFKGGYWTED